LFQSGKLKVNLMLKFSSKGGSVAECFRALDFKSGGPWFKSSTLLLSGFVLKFSERMSALQNKQTKRKRILPFVTEYWPSRPNLKHILMSKWHLIGNQPLLTEIYQDPPLLSYRKGRSLKNVLVRAKL